MYKLVTALQGKIVKAMENRKNNADYDKALLNLHKALAEIKPYL